MTTPIKQKPLPDPEGLKPNTPIRKERLDDEGKEMITPDAKVDHRAAKDRNRIREGNI